MAAAVSFVSLTFSFVPKFSLKPLLFSPLSTTLHSKPTKRKNYLRPKILKTLTKPLPSLVPNNPITPLEEPPPETTKPIDVVVFEPVSDKIPNPVLEETDKVEEFRVSETSAVAEENVGSFESRQERLLAEVLKSRKSRDLDTQNSQIFSKENQETRNRSVNNAFSRTSRSSDVSKRPPANKVKVNQSGIKNDPWWQNLPYVVAIFMRGGVDRDGGLFTLPVSSEGQEQSKTFCIVAFEDHSDANNFFYLLECSFDDPSGFSAEVVLMSVKELCEALKSHTEKVIVVKKGQLKLYAGQPFVEVEMALHSLIEDNQCASFANSE